MANGVGGRCHTCRGAIKIQHGPVIGVGPGLSGRRERAHRRRWKARGAPFPESLIILAFAVSLCMAAPVRAQSLIESMQTSIQAGCGTGAGFDNGNAFSDDFDDFVCDELVTQAADADGGAGPRQADVTIRNANFRNLGPDEVPAQETVAVELMNVQFQNIGARLAALRAGGAGISTKGLALHSNGRTLPGEAFEALFAAAATGGGASADPPQEISRLGVFINGSISFGDKDGSDQEGGFDFDSQGVTAGVDYRFTDSLLFGVAFGVAFSDVENDGGAGTTDVTGYTVSVYGNHYVTENFFIDGMASFTWSSIDSQRNITIVTTTTGTQTEVASGDTDGRQYAFSVGAGYDFTSGAWTFGPYARAAYMDGDIDGYTESGAPLFGLAFSDQDFDSLQSTLGGQVSYAIATTWGTVVPQVRIEWGHEFENDRRNIVAQFIAEPVPISTPTEDPDRNFFSLGLGLSAFFGERTSAFVDYSTALGLRDTTSHTLTAGLRLQM